MSKLIIQLESWAEKGALRLLDVALTRFIKEQIPQASDALLLATALVSERNGHGHVCLDLQTVLQQPELQLVEDERIDTTEEAVKVADELTDLIEGWTLASWVEQLLTTDAVADKRTANAASDSASNSSPLVLAGSLKKPFLYLRRYWVYEQQIHKSIQARLKLEQNLPKEATRLLLDQLFEDFKPSKNQPIDWQKIACALAARRGFGIITGGPGTGKTTTVVRLLALLQGLQMQAGKTPLVIRLAAPTGKAAARLSESLAGSVAQVKLPADLAVCRKDIPTEVSTLHRLLGSQPGTRHFRHHAGNPLAADLVVVDEASMVDVEMLARLLDALTPETRLILLGDKDQLASVEAGSVLGDFCQNADQGNYTQATQTWLKENSGQLLPSEMLNEEGSLLAQATSMLRHSYRFHTYPGIGELAELVNTGQASAKQLEAVFASYQREDEAISTTANLALIKLAKPNYQKPATEQQDPLVPLKSLVRKGYSHYLTTLIEQKPSTANREDLDAWALAIFAAHREFQLLTAVRRSIWGVEALNEMTLAALKQVDKFKDLLTGTQLWYSGRPVLVTRNDYSLKLMNGDIGICLEWPASDDSSNKKLLRVAFPDGKGGVRWVLPSRLQGVETVFAMTVHKSQGSEFTHAALVLPSADNPVLTKELLYTGITRSSQAFTLIYSDESVLESALTKKVERASGLQAS
ncbi:exodeoxyribonuclease V subunit alpha [Marinospirillum insulare]|uniref:RecBCD enzyme subunit RecD n=1 Tax=Marinospirillum insulare TaxID=217169 RepID=A0ABQ5ZTV6_9GAMM|nr:exodeoxyribonuclease V subunit alpha [Marinospirillum insulare]GLR63591.1 RecBCD enzyme subunit RecD [Marinospirillum insulare]